MRSEKEISEAIVKINSNKNLSYGYRADVIAVLNWMLDDVPFDGLGD